MTFILSRAVVNSSSILRVAPTVGDVALGTIGVQVGPHADLQVALVFVGVHQLGTVPRAGRRGPAGNSRPRSSVNWLTALSVSSCLLFICSVHRPRTKFGGPRVAHHALGPAEKLPGLLPCAARSGGVANPQLELFPLFADEPRVGLGVVPGVRIAEPFARLVSEQPRFDLFAGGRIAVLHVEREGLHDHGPIHKLPAAGRGGIDRVAIWHREEPRETRPVVPDGRVDGVANHAGGWALVGDRREKSRLAQPLGKAGHPLFGGRVGDEPKNLARKGH